MPVAPAEAAHLLSRAGFGATPAEIEALAAATDWSAAVDQVLDTSANPPVVPPPGMGRAPVNTYPSVTAAALWWLERMRTTPTPLVEKMTLFWHGHFVSTVDTVPVWAIFDQLQLYRSRGLGDLHDLTQRMAVNPAMLLYLDNFANRAGAENENFARELMELFTMGNFTFTEDDVIAMARAWTGHGLNFNGTYLFRPSWHDNGQKSLFGITRNWDGPATITEILRGSQRTVAARFIAAKLWSFLAAPDPPASVVDDLAGEFLAADLDLRSLVRAIFLHPEFRSPATRVGLVRSPIEWVVAVLRALDLPVEVAHPEWWLPDMGQVPFAPPNVSGWKQNGAWLSTTAAWARAGFLSHVRWIATNDGLPYRRFPGLATSPPAEVADRAFEAFGITEPAAQTRQVIEDWATDLQQPGQPTWSIRPNVIPVTALSPDFQLA